MVDLPRCSAEFRVRRSLDGFYWVARRQGNRSSTATVGDVSRDFSTNATSVREVMGSPELMVNDTSLQDTRVEDGSECESARLHLESDNCEATHDTCDAGQKDHRIPPV